MAINDPDPGVLGKVRFVFLTLRNPEVVAREATDALQLPGPDSYDWMLYRSRAVRRGFFTSLGVVSYIGALGFMMGRIAFREIGENNIAVLIFGAIGGLIFFWATLAIRGWEIETMEGSSLPERINQWIFRGLYLLGTLLVVMSGSWGIGHL
ncbi:hypothetical protein [Chelativorans sp. M5D2P16]|uniref:hypothetical protein n=1 Tax=Chelativorans sp. M5D2P16 TaxID=3095678 RepID=UPI002ACA052D|nr:hypothetical protein [Chelativorans sp. M5D2P16]MDZ5699857.1 hypothetical protein [Chelativorans sp. M5D2P16]